MAVQNMRLITEVQPLLRRDFEVAQSSLLNPNASGSASNPKHLLDGEFLSLNASYKAAREGAKSAVAGGQLVNPAAAGSVALAPWFAFWLERGRSDMQAIQKATLLFSSGYEADFSADVLSSVDNFEVGDKLYVNWLEDGVDANRRRGLTKVKNAGDDGLVHAYVTRVYPVGSEYRMRALLINP